MYIAITVFHIIFSVGLIATVLLQYGRSAGLSGAIAGGAESIFGKKKGLDDLLGRTSTVFALLFMGTSIALTLLH